MLNCWPVIYSNFLKEIPPINGNVGILIANEEIAEPGRRWVESSDDEEVAPAPKRRKKKKKKALVWKWKLFSWKWEKFSWKWKYF